MNTRSMSTRTDDVIIVGSGIGGLACALSMAPRSVTVVTKTPCLEGGSSLWAQGGIAAAVGPGDSPEAHAVDTITAGAGLTDPERAQQLTEEGAASLPGTPIVHTDLQEVLARDDGEAVDVVLPIQLLPDVVEASLAAGKHVVSEKPVAATSGRADALLAFRERHPDPVWMVAENWRYEASFLAAAEAVREGAIGRPVLFDWTVAFPIRPGHRYHATAWRRTGEVPGGFLLDGGVHFAAVLRQVLGELVEARGFTASEQDDLPPCDTLAASMRFDSGAVGTLAVSFAVGVPWESELRVAGSEGSLAVAPGRLAVTRDGKTDVRTFPYPTGVAAELVAFAEAVRHGTPHRNSPEEALADLRLVEALL